MWVSDAVVTSVCDGVDVGILLWSCLSFNQPITQLGVLPTLGASIVSNALAAVQALSAWCWESADVDDSLDGGSLRQSAVQQRSWSDVTGNLADVFQRNQCHRDHFLVAGDDPTRSPAGSQQTCQMTESLYRSESD